MKRILSGLVASVMALSLLAGCGQGDTALQEPEQQQTATVEAGYEDGVSIRVAALKGPTARGLVQMM